MPGGDRRVYKLIDLFTKDELHRAMKLFIECKNTKENLHQRCAQEVVGPIISRVYEHAGYNPSPASLVYRIEIYLRALRGEERVIHHRRQPELSCFADVETNEQDDQLVLN